MFIIISILYEKYRSEGCCSNSDFLSLLVLVGHRRLREEVLLAVKGIELAIETLGMV